MSKPFGSSAEIADYLVHGFWDYWGGGARHWARTTVTFNVTGLTAAGQASAARAAFAEWSNVTGLVFECVAEGGDIRLSTAGDGTANGGADRVEDGIIRRASVQVAADWAVGQYAPGGYGYETMLHEIGHTLGLGHSGPYDVGDPASHSTVDNLWVNDTRQYSIMSYNTADAFDGGASRARVTTPMLADILAVQSLYGTNPQANAGDSAYGRAAGPASAYGIVDRIGNEFARAFTIVDGGGTDVIDMSGSVRGNVIRLLPETFSSLGGFIGNVAIAPGSIIEDARGGTVDDAIFGNAADNRLSGDGGDDTLGGFDGDDLLLGGAGDDALVGHSGNDWLEGGDGRDTLTGSGADTLLGGSGDDRFCYDDALFGANGRYDGGGGTDTLVVFAGTTMLGDGANLTGIECLGVSASPLELAARVLSRFQVLVSSGATTTASLVLTSGGEAALRIEGLTAVTLHGSAAADAIDLGGGGGTTATIRFAGLGGADRVVAGRGEDRLAGGLGQDTVAGGGGGDVLRGNRDGDRLIGEAGDDTLVGGGGDDTLTGGAGRDSFAFSPSGGGAPSVDRVTDFTDGIDHLLLRDTGAAFDSFAAVHAASRDLGDSELVIEFGTLSVRVAGLTKAQFDASDVLFA